MSTVHSSWQPQRDSSVLFLWTTAFASGCFSTQARNARVKASSYRGDILGISWNGRDCIRRLQHRRQGDSACVCSFPLLREVFFGGILPQAWSMMTKVRNYSLKVLQHSRSHFVPYQREKGNILSLRKPQNSSMAYCHGSALSDKTICFLFAEPFISAP